MDDTGTGGATSGNPGFTMDPRAFTQAIAGFTTCAASSKKAMVALDGGLRSALSRYSGRQAVALWQLHGRLDEAMQTARQQLDYISMQLTQAQKDYNISDQSVVDLLSSAGNQLGGSPGWGARLSPTG